MKKGNLIMGLCLLSILFVVVGSAQKTYGLNNNIIRILEPKSSQFTEINPIFIGDNLSYYESTYDWCTGSGTEEDPYIIEGISIGNINGTAGITFYGSSEYLIIRNCNFYNITAPYGHYIFAGIYSEKTENFVIQNCTFYHCFYGVSIIEAKENTLITGCDFIGAHNDSAYSASAIHIENEAKGVTVSYNNIINWYTGIYAYNAEEIIIENNYIENLLFGYEVETGVYFYSVNDSIIRNNDFYGCNFTQHSSSGLSTSSYSSYPIVLENCINIQVYGNTFHPLGEVILPDFLIQQTILTVSLLAVLLVLFVYFIRKRNKK